MKLSSEYISSLEKQLKGKMPEEKEVYLLENSIDQLRVCNECGKLMEEGYCIDGGIEHYCSDVCLHKHFSEETYMQKASGEDSDTYYSVWNE